MRQGGFGDVADAVVGVGGRFGCQISLKVLEQCVSGIITTVCMGLIFGEGLQL